MAAPRYRDTARGKVVNSDVRVGNGGCEQRGDSRDGWLVGWLVSQLVSLEPSQPLIIILGLNFTPSFSYSAHKSLNVKHTFPTAKFEHFT